MIVYAKSFLNQAAACCSTARSTAIRDMYHNNNGNASHPDKPQWRKVASQLPKYCFRMEVSMKRVTTSIPRLLSVSIPVLPVLLTTIFWPSASAVAQTQSIYAANPLQSALNGIGSFASELPPHLRVQFVLTSMEHIVAEGSGVRV
jgi:hypothetical protein